MPVLEQIDTPFFIERCTREAWSIFKGIHYHNCYELYYLEDGEIVYFINERIYLARAGDFVLIPPGAVHKTLPRHSLAHTRTLIYFLPEFLHLKQSESETLFGGLSEILITLGNRAATEQLLGALLKEAEGEHDPLMLRALLTQFLIFLHRWSAQESALAVPRQVQGGSGAEAKVQEVVRYLEQHFTEELSLPALAERFYMNAAYLSRIFRRVTGLTYSDYLIRLRLQKAARLLRTGDKKVAEIAAETGFHSDNHFCKTFRRHFGVSPRRFRHADDPPNGVYADYPPNSAYAHYS